MANNRIIQTLRSYANTAPTTLVDGQQAYSFLSKKLFIGNNTNHIITIGGEYYTNVIDSAANTNLPSTLVKRNSDGDASFRRLTSTFSPSDTIDVVNKGYIDNVMAASHGSIYYGTPLLFGYSNVVTSSEGVDFGVNNGTVARFRDGHVYFDTNVTITNDLDLRGITASGNISGQAITAYDKFYAGLASSLATPVPYLIAQFTGNTAPYVQVNLQNIEGQGSADYVVTADVGTDTTFFTDVGIQGSQLNQGALKALDGYLLVQGNTGQPGGNLVIGTISGTPALETKFVNGGYEENNVVMVLRSEGLTVNGQIVATSIVSPTLDNINSNVTSALSYTDTANTFNKNYTDTANTFNKNYTDTANTFLQANDRSTLTSAQSYTDTANTWLQANDRTTLTLARSYTDTANLWLQANTGDAKANAKAYTDTANTWLQANDRSTLTLSQSYTDTANLWLQANTGNAKANARAYTDTANTWLQANDRTTLTLAQSYTDTANTWLQANDRTTLTLARSYTDTANTWLQANTGDAKANARAYTDTANTWLQANDRTTLTSAQSYTDAANTWLQANTGNAKANARAYTDTANTWLQANDFTTLTTAKAYTDTANSYNITFTQNYVNTANTFLQANDNITLGVAKNYTDTTKITLENEITANLANARAYTDTANTWLKANDYLTWTTSQSYTDTTKVALQGQISSNLSNARTYTDTANTFLQANDYTTLTVAKGYTDVANSWLQANDRSTLANAKSYTDTANTWLQANDRTTLTVAQTYTDNTNVYVRQLITSTNAYVLTVQTNAQAAFDKANSANAFAQQVYDSSNTKFSSSGGYITGFANVSSNISVGTTIDFDPNPATEATQKEGRIFYDKFSKAFGGYNDTERYIHFGRDLGIRVFNSTGNTINIASPVFILNEPASNGAPHIAKADATTAANSEVIGLTQTAIANGTFGMVISQGLIEYLDTTGYTVGQELFLSTTPGQFTTTCPATPNIPLNVGYIGSVSPLYGEIIVNIHLMEGTNKTTGAILFARNQLIDQDPDHLFWDYNNNRLGIGTNTPTANLHVIGSGLFTGNVTISGNLLISNAQSITTSELVVAGNTVVLNSTVTGVPTTDAQVIVKRGTSANAYIRWNETLDKWALYGGSGVEGDLLDSEKTFLTWTAYSANTAYKKSNYPIGADLANTTNELARGANSYAYSAYSQANVATNLAQSSYNYANNVNIFAGSAYNQANTANTRAYSTALKSGDTFSGGVTVPTLTANTSVTVNAIAQFTSTSYVTSSTSQVTLDTFAATTYRSAKYEIQATSGTKYHVLEARILHDGTTSWITQYGEMWTQGTLGTFSTDVTGGNVTLLFTPVNSVTTVKLKRSTITV